MHSHKHSLACVHAANVLSKINLAVLIFWCMISEVLYTTSMFHFSFTNKSPRKTLKNILNSWLMSKKSNEQRHRSNLYNNMRYLTSALLHIWHCNANEPHSTSVLRQPFCKHSVLRRQSRDRNRNIKWSVYCQYG